MSDSTSQPSSKATKSGSSRYFQERSNTVTFILKFFLYRIVNRLNIPSIQKDSNLILLSFARRSLARISTSLNFDFDFSNAKFHWFVRYQIGVLIGLKESRLSRACIKKILLDQEVNNQNFPSFVELILGNILLKQQRTFFHS